MFVHVKLKKKRQDIVLFIVSFIQITTARLCWIYHLLSITHTEQNTRQAGWMNIVAKFCTIAITERQQSSSFTDIILELCFVFYVLCNSQHAYVCAFVNVLYVFGWSLNITNSLSFFLDLCLSFFLSQNSKQDFKIYVLKTFCSYEQFY